MKFSLKNRVIFFLLKMKIKRVIEDLKFKKKRMIVKIVKIYLGLSLVLLWAVWDQFIFG